LGTAVQLPSIECKQIEEAESAVVRRLPKQMARVYSVSRFEYLDISEIAQKMNLSKRTVEYHLYMARKRVRESVRIAIGM
jgi:RNA polymerase sigma-70 factor (ECF subfamily)